MSPDMQQTRAPKDDRDSDWQHEWSKATLKSAAIGHRALMRGQVAALAKKVRTAVMKIIQVQTNRGSGARVWGNV